MTVWFKDATNHAVPLRVRPTTRVSEVLSVYTAKRGLNSEDIKLVFHGERVDGRLVDCGIKDGDVVDIFMRLVGD